MIAIDVMKKIDKEDLSWAEVEKILNSHSATYEHCTCGSQYCEICNGSVDPTIEVSFPDRTKMEIANPMEEVYHRFCRIIE